MMSPARASTNLPHQGLAVQFTGRVTHHPGLLCYLSTRFVPRGGLTACRNPLCGRTTARFRRWLASSRQRWAHSPSAVGTSASTVRTLTETVGKCHEVVCTLSLVTCTATASSATLLSSFAGRTSLLGGLHRAGEVCPWRGDGRKCRASTMRPHTEAVMPRVPRSDPKITALSLLVSRCRP